MTAVVHGFDTVTRKPYTYVIPDPKEKTEVANVDPLMLTIAVERKSDSYVAALRDAPDGLVLAAAKPTVSEAVSTLVETYLKLNPLDAERERATPKRFTDSTPRVPSRRARTYAHPTDIRRFLTEAAAEKKRVYLAKVDHADGTAAIPRDFTPYEIRETNEGHDLLVGWDHLRKRIGSFRLDRISRIVYES